MRARRRAQAPRNATSCALALAYHSRMRAEALELIWRTVVAIPRGEIATYGGIARRAGLPGRARMVGHALKVAPAALALPWHRVVGAGGRIAFPKGSRQHAEQARRLAEEGVAIVCGRVVHSAVPDLDELLWKPE
jgi:methylated-DNA-protein-cysteine methyltransferase related protein